MHTTNDKWHSDAKSRNKVIEYFEKDAVKLRGDKRRILFSFLSDPYQPLEREVRLTQQALSIVHKYQLKSQILTKGCVDLIQEDMALMKKSDTHLGITLCFSDDEMRKEWEPNASSVNDRMNVLKKAHKAGIFTWISLEPVIDPKQALAVIKTAHKYVHFWKVGKLNHMKEDESKVNWTKFLVDVEDILKKYNTKYYIKNDLRAFAMKKGVNGLGFCLPH
jgi:DNA repair photolyase